MVITHPIVEAAAPGGVIGNGLASPAGAASDGTASPGVASDGAAALVAIAK